MGLITNGMVLLFSLFAFNHIYALLRRPASKVPTLQPSWIDFITWKPLQTILDQGYRTYSKASRIFRCGDDSYIIPPSLYAEVRTLPGSILNSHVANEDFILLSRTLGPNYIDVTPFIRAVILHSIPRLASIFQDEISSQFESYYSSTDGTWRSLPLLQTTFEIMSCVALRIMVGGTLSNDRAFTAKIRDFVRAVSVESLLLRQVPKFLRPVVAFFLPHNRVRVLKGWLRAPILETLGETEDGSVVLKSRECKPDDPLLPQLVEYVFKKLHDPKNPSALTRDRVVDEVTSRFLALVFGTVDTTSITFAQVFFDLACHPRAQFADKIRAEIDSALAAQNGAFGAVCISKLKHLDSFIKESQRLHPIGSHLPRRAVMPLNGWTFSNGDHVPQGAICKLPTSALHYDETAYDRPTEFDGFRFVNDKHPESFPSNTFLAFGHGNHSCPGRVMALAMVKCMVIELLTRYEYEEMAERPPDLRLETAIVANMTQHIRIRRVR